MPRKVPKPDDQYRVYCKARASIKGWASPRTMRYVYGITANRVIRKEIMVYWDDTYPHGFIDTHEIVRIR